MFSVILSSKIELLSNAIQQATQKSIFLHTLQRYITVSDYSLQICQKKLSKNTTFLKTFDSKNVFHFFSVCLFDLPANFSRSRLIQYI